MAIIKFGGGIAEMRGSIGGTVFARNRSGAYARNRTKPINPNTARQQAVRSRMSTLNNRWLTILTNANRASWALYADGVEMLNKLGEVMHLSGINQFVRTNSARLQNGLGVLDSAPSILDLGAQDPTMVATYDSAAGSLSLAFDDTLDWASESSAFASISMGQPANSASSFFNGPWRHFGTLLGNSAAPLTSPQVLTDAPYPMGAGQGINTKVRIQRGDGRYTEPFQAPEDIV